MDYSLLLAIEKNKLAKRTSNIQEDLNTETIPTSGRYTRQSSDEKFTYHLSLIDFLQDWNLKKRMERFAKTKLRNKDPAGLSAIEPSAYQKRFHRFIEGVFTGMKYDQQDSTYKKSTSQVISRTSRTN